MITTKPPIYQIGFVILLVLAFVVVVAIYLPFGDDWHHSFRPAARAMMFGQSPYQVDTFLNPPWALLPLAPMAILPENIGRAVLMACTLIAFAYTAHRLGAGPIAMVFFLLSPPVVQCFLTANIDWLATLGFVLPPPIGLFFVLAKPQIGGIVALFWLVEIWRQDGFKRVVFTFLPVTIVLLVSLLLYGLWPMRLLEAPAYAWNASLWPSSLPVGLALVVAALYRRKMQFAMAASPCLAPYLALQSWSGALLSFVSKTPETAAAVIGLWLLVGLQFMV